MDLELLKSEILKDGVIDAAEVKQLQAAVFEDGIIDAHEVALLMELNNEVSGKANHPSWEQFFIKAVAAYMLEDVNSPGEIDEDEAEWLHEQLSADGKIDNVERNLLLHLKERSSNFPDILQSLLD
jgi:uncharacterized membrane protein YebE (DUF533 family)